MCLKVAAENKGFSCVKRATLSIVEVFNNQDKGSYWHYCYLEGWMGYFVREKEYNEKQKSNHD